MPGEVTPEAPLQPKFTRKEMLKAHGVYEDDEDHLLMLPEEEVEEGKKKRGMPHRIKQYCPSCTETKVFDLSKKPDLIDIECEYGHRYSISPKLVPKELADESSGKTTFPCECLGCGKETNFSIDWETRQKELEAWAVRS